MKKTLLILLLLIAGMFIQLSANAVPAKPGLIEFRQPDGTIVNVYLHGDEKTRWATTTDGYTLLFNSQGYYEYAVLDNRSDLIPSGIIARNPENRDASAVSFLTGVSKNLFYSQEQISYLGQIREIYNNEAKSAKAFPTSGTRKLVCILIGFTDKAFVKTQADFNSLFNQIGYTAGSATGSVKDFYLENSYNQFNLTVDVAGPYTASNTMAYYGTNSPSDDYRVRDLVTEAVTLANADVNYADYDNDANGSVDGVYIIYAGYGEEAGAPATTIWAHAWSISTLTFDGKTISKYSCSPELRGTSGTNITRIGVICHEFGHVLGAPDYYDTDYTTGGQYDGTGFWDIMAAGSWNNDGATPAHHNAYTKTSVYGWATATTLSTDQNVALLNAEQNSSSFYKYTTTTSNEYFLLENRQLVGFDAALPGHGMLIYHVDGSYITSHMSANDINAGSHQGMYPMAANSSTANGIMTGDGAVSTSGCPWPGTSSKTTFTDATTPNSKSWASANTAKPLLNITETSGVVQFCFISCPPACTPPTTQASSFSTSAIGDNQMTVNWTRGNGTSVIVVAREGSSVDANPFNGVVYTANAAFGSGTEIGTGNYVIYKGTGTNVVTTGLQPGTNYYYSVYEFFTADNCYNITALTGTAQTTGTAACDICYSWGHTDYATSTTKVIFNTINNSSAKPVDANSNAYSDYTAISTNVNIGSSYNLTVNINTDGNYNASSIAWIDWNQNCSFDDPGEEYQLGSAANQTDGPTSLCPFAISVPLSAIPGTTRMRVSTMYNDPGVTVYPSSCETNFDGETEDYTVVVNSVVGPAILTNLSSLSFGNVEVGTSSELSYQLAGFNLTGNLTITTPADFQISPTSGSGFTNSLILTPVSGSVGPFDIYVKFEPQTVQTYSSTLTNSSTGATTVNISLNGVGGHFTPIADFSGTPTTILGGSSVTFTDLSTGTAPTSWSWTFEGGTPSTSSDQNPVITYNTPGTYDVTLIATNANGSDTKTVVDYITVVDPNTCFCDYIDHIPGSSVYYSVSGGYLSGNNSYGSKAIAEYFDNTTGYNNMEGAYFGFAKAYVNNNSTMITFNVWDDNGAASGSFSYSPGTVLATKTISLKTIADDIANGNLTYVDFGAPINVTGTNFFIGFTIPNPGAAGDTLVLLTSQQNAGTNEGWDQSSTSVWSSYYDGWGASFNNAVYPILCATGIPNSDFYANETTVSAGSQVIFTDATTCSPTSWSWSFAGGTPATSTSQNPTITYNTPGVYAVSLTATNATGSDTYTRSGYITVLDAAVTIVTWNFPNNPDNATSDGGITVNNGTRSISVGGGVGTPTYATAGASTRCATATGWATGNGTKYWQVSFQTSGYQMLKLSSKLAGNNTGSPRDFKVQYSLNGTTWIDVPYSNTTSLNAVWTSTGNLTNISLPAACNNMSLIYLRWIMRSNLSVNGGTIGSTRECRIDDIIVTGVPIPVAPVADFSASATSVCPNVAVNFTDLSTNTPTSWAWSFTGGTPATSTAQNPSVTYSTPGTYQVSLTATNTGGSDVETKVGYITVNSVPTISASNAGPYCVGQTIALNATGSGGTSYSWTGPVSFTSAVEDPTRTNALTTYAGTYTVVLTNTATGCTASATTNVTVNANPVISASNSGPYCAGSTIALSATGTGGNTFAWTGPDSYSTSTEDPSIVNCQTVNAGTYTVVYTNTTTGCTASANTVVAVNALPTLAPVNGGPYCAGQTITLTANGAGGTGYAWTGPNTFTSTASNPTITNGQSANAGTYTVVLTNTTSGCTASGTTTVVINAVPAISASNTGPYCAGQTISLSATGSGGTGYAWTGPLSFASAVEDPTRTNALTTHSGTYTVVLTNTTSGCTASATTNVTVNALPVISASNTGPYCAGQTIQLNATGSGGTGYAWTGPLSFASAVEDPTRTNALTTHSGTYTVVLTNTTSGCTASATTNVTVNALPTLSASNTGPYCAGQTIQLNATGSGGTGYSWTGPLSFTSAVEDPARTGSLTTHSGTYTVVLTNTTSGCTASATTDVTVNALPAISASNTGPYCAGQTIQLNATGSGGTGYSWTGPLSFTSAVEDPTRPGSLTTHSGTYTVVLTNTTTGCTASATTDVTVNALPTISASNTGPYCAGQTIQLNATGSGGTGYSWTGPLSFSSAVEDPARTASLTTHSGTYTVVLTNTTSGCTASATTNVTVNALPTLSASNTGPYCAGQTIQLNATGSGGTGYAWTGPQSFSSAVEDPSRTNALTTHSGTYTVVITNTTSGCTASATTNVVVNSLPVVEIGTTINLCPGIAQVLDAGAGLTYQWSTFETTQTISVNTTGTYSVTVTDGNSCTASDNVVVNYYPATTLSMSSTPESATSMNDGTATVVPTGTSPFGYLWDGGQTSPSISGLTGGNYSVTVEDGNGCTVSGLVNVSTNNTPPVADFTANMVSICAGQSVTFTDLSANSPTSWSWTFDGATTTTSNIQNPVITYTTPGSWMVELTVANTNGSDTETKVAYITVNTNPTLSASNSGPYCAGQTIALNATGTGGTAYAWTGPAGFTSTVEDPSRTNALTTHSGAYSVVLTNTTTGCTASATTNVTVNAIPTISASNAGPYCAGQTIALNATGTGGTGYAWTGPLSFTSSVEDPARANSLTTHSGTYTVVLTNTTTGCTASATTDVTVNALPLISASNSGPYCAGQTIQLNATGSGATSYEWTGPDGFTSTVEDPARTGSLTTYSGTYTVVLTNTATNCSASATTDVTVNALPVISASNSGPYCETQTISLNATGSGGTGYAWTGPAGFTSAVEDPARANAITSYGGNYTVVLTNTTSGCTASAVTNVVINDNPVVDIAPAGPVCEGQNIAFDATGSGGTQYSWSGPDSFSASVEDPSASNLQSVNAGLYTVTLTNSATGCFNTASVNLVVNENPVVSAANSGPYCEGGTLSLDAAGTGGTSYSWTGPDGFNSTDEDPVIANAQMINDGTYVVVYTNTTTGCSETASTIVEINANPTVSLGADQSTCDYNTVTLDAGEGFVSYTWNGVAGTSTYIVPASDTYTVVVEDANGCTASDIVDITIYTSHTVTVTTTPESGTGMNDGTASFSAVGGTYPITWTWSVAQTGNTITGLGAGVYCVTVVDVNNCTATACGTVNTDNAPPVASFTTDVTEGCVPVTVNFTDASTNNPLTWLWNFDGTNTANTANSSFTFDTPGTYTVVLTVENLDGTDSYEVEINVYGNPVVELGDNITECDGNTVVLDATDAFDGYLWTGGFDTQTIDVTGGGDYYVTVTNANGCTGTDMISVLFNPLPVIELGDDFSICDNVEYSLDAGEGYASYLWNGTTAGQILIIDAAGTYTIEVTNNFYCPATDEITITEIPSPVVDLPATADVCAGDPFTYTLTGTYDWILWSDDSTTPAFTVTYDEPGSYEVWVNVGVGSCQDVDTMIVVANICENIEIINGGTELELYPNPANNISNLIIKNYTGELTYSLIDVQGKEIIVNTINVYSEYSKELDLRDLVPGMYVLRITTNNEVTNLKLIRE